MSTKPTPVVGQTLYSLNVGNSARNTPQALKAVIVRRVGRKYFACSAEGMEDEWHWIEYYLDTWREHNSYSANSQLYSGVQERLDEVEAQRICNFIGDTFMYGLNKHKLSIETLRKIELLITENKHE